MAKDERNPKSEFRSSKEFRIPNFELRALNPEPRGVPTQLLPPTHHPTTPPLHFFLRRHECVTEPVGVADSPQIQGPGAAPVLEITHAPIHKRVIGASSASAFAHDGMT